MAKRRKKRRGKRREPQQQLPRPNRGDEQPLRPNIVLPTTVQAEQVVASASLDDNDTGKATDRTVVGTVLEVEREFIWIETEGARAKLYGSELMLDIGEVPEDRYAPGDRFKAFVFQMGPDPESGAPQFSIRRAAPYLDALNRLEVGSVVANATVVNTYDAGIELDIDGVRGNAMYEDLPLARDESRHDRYQPGDTVHALFVWQVNRDGRELALSARRNAPGYVEALNAHHVGDVVPATITGFTSRGGLWLDVGGVIGSVAPDELSLAAGETAQDRYAVGDTVDALLVWLVDHGDRDLSLSVRRNTPGYVEALNAHSVGDVVSATVTGFQSDDGLWLDVGGVIGSMSPWNFPLADDESSQDHYAVGDTIHDLFVWQVDQDDRDLSLSARRSAPTYVEALNAHSVGDVVSATVTGFQGNGGLLLDVGGVIGSVPPWELSLADGGSAQDHYVVGGTVNDLLVWQVNHDSRELFLSVRRNAPGYVEALDAHNISDVVSATVTGFPSNGGLILDVGGVIAVAPLCDLSLAADESAQAHYTVGDTVHNLFVWQVDHDARDLALSLKRNAPGYVEALQRRVVGEVVSGPITGVETAGLSLDVHGLVGVIPASELQLDARQSPLQRYSVGETIAARVWMIDRTSRMVLLSARRHAAGFREEQVERGATIDAVVRGTTRRDIRMPIRVLTTYSDSSVEIPPHALSLSTGMPPHFEDNQTIRVVVVELDDKGRPTRLSHRQALDGWEAEMRRLSHNTVVPNARPVPPEALSDAELGAGAAAVDLGPIIGVIPEDELDRETGRYIATYNETYQVVVESVDDERRIATVSHERFEERWRAVAGQLALEEGAEVEGELRDFDRETALFDLGSGLLAQMPMRELPDSDPPGKAEVDRIGERFSLRITNVDPGKQTVHVEPRDQWIEALVGEPESETLEFKEVLRGDPGADDAREMTRQAMRTINAFLNAEGGRLIVGVHDETREVTGLEGDPGLDADTIEKKIDQATQILESNLANLEPLDLLRDDLSGLVAWETPSVRGRTLLVITCKRGPDAGVNLKIKGKPEFWVRDGSSKKQLRTQNEIRDHLRTRQQRATTAGDAVADA